MPLYEYRCDNCGDVFEVIQKFSDAPLETHQKCGGTVHRLISAPALQFKGTGWYVTDYAKGGSSAEKTESSSHKNESSSQKSESSGDNGASKKTDAPAGTSSGSHSSSAPAPASGSSSDKKSSSSETK